MRTAYSTQPRIPQPERELPKYASFEDALEAMKADAAETMKRVEADRTQLNKNAPLADRNIHAYLEHNPGASTTDVATHFGRDVNSVSSMMSRMEERGMVTVAKRRLPHGGLGRFFTGAKAEEATQNGHGARLRHGEPRPDIARNRHGAWHDIAGRVRNCVQPAALSQPRNHNPARWHRPAPAGALLDQVQ